MNFIDIIIIVLVLILCIRGYLKGFVNELFSLLIIGLGLLGAFLFYRPLSEVFLEFVDNSDVALVFSFFALFILISIFLIIIRNVIVQFVDRLNLTDMDALLGVIVGLLKALILCGVVFVFLKYHPVFRFDESIERSFIYPYLERALVAFISIFPGRVSLLLYRILGIV
jgi:membrane protein required for colicin V production